MKYVFQERKWKVLMPFIDALLSLLPRPELHPPEKILIFRADGIGDTILTLPFIETVLYAFPESSVSVCVPPECACLFQGKNRIEHVLTFRGPWFRARREESSKKFVRYLALFQFDTAFEPRGDFRHILLLRRAGIRQVISFGITGGAPLLSYCAPYTRGVSVIENHKQLLKPFGITDWLSFSLALTEADRAFQKTLQLRFQHLPRPFLAFHPFASSSAKQWPLFQWKVLLARLRLKLPGTFFLLGERREERAMSYIGNESCYLLPGFFSLRELYFFLQECRGFVGVDSGIAHLAALSGVPSLLLFSGTNDRKEYAPLSSCQKILSYPVPCAPCEREVCSVTDHPCMTGISIEEVEQEILSWCP